MSTITDTAATGRYDGPGLYEVTDGTRVYLDPVPEPQAQFLDGWLVRSETVEGRGKRSGNWWLLRDVIEPAIVRKIEEGGQ
jgi:hypothetical protein